MIALGRHGLSYSYEMSSGKRFIDYSLLLSGSSEGGDEVDMFRCWQMESYLDSSIRNVL